MSASPPASPNDAQATGQTAKPEKEQVKFRFCGDCSNMLAPREDRINNKLMYHCRMCQYSEEADSACVFRNSIYNIIGETAGVTQDVGSDPTVGLPDLWCILCGQEITCDRCGRVDGGGLEDEEVDLNDLDHVEEEPDVSEMEGSEHTAEAAAGNDKAHETDRGGAAAFEQTVPQVPRERSGLLPVATAIGGDRDGKTPQRRPAPFSVCVLSKLPAETLLRLLQLRSYFPMMIRWDECRA
ncbi:MAG: hypothetical protein Q9166_002987 [cf. Caloplaca sp. 2 TL-2023]